MSDRSAFTSINSAEGQWKTMTPIARFGLVQGVHHSPGSASHSAVLRPFPRGQRAIRGIMRSMSGVSAIPTLLSASQARHDATGRNIR